MLVKFGLILMSAVISAKLWAGPKNSELFNPNAPKGGVFTEMLGAEPPNLNPLSYEDLYATFIFAYTVPQLLTRNSKTYEWEPYFAESWIEAKDGKTITFKLREGLVWQDGQPLTAEDVKFSWEAIFNPAYGAAPKIPYVEGFEKVEALDARTVKFTTKKKYFGNFEAAAVLSILPKHIYGDPTKGPKITKDVIGAGPYMLEKWDVGQKIVLKRNPRFFGYSDPNFKPLYNFDKIVFRPVKDATVRIEMMKKGDADFVGISMVSPEDYEKRAVGPEWSGKAQKKKIETLIPKSRPFLGFNLKNELFKEKATRLAMTHLCNRELMIEKFRFGYSVPAPGPWHYKSEYAPPNAPALKYDPKKAAELLNSAGWSDSDKDGVLDRLINGKKTDFRFTLAYANKDSEKYWTTYKEDLARAGIRMELRLMEWNAFQKMLDDRSFDMIAMAWGGGSVDFYPKQIWHSSSANGGGSNFISYSNPKVDKLIEEGGAELDKKKRIAIYHKIFNEIAADAPYVFLWDGKYEFYLHSGRMGMKSTHLPYSVGQEGWWLTNIQ